jgi:diadenosine tetraphosphate (Ap4A) HIT family hydrolase
MLFLAQAGPDQTREFDRRYSNMFPCEFASTADIQLWHAAPWFRSIGVSTALTGVHGRQVMEVNEIHPQLWADCHYLGSLPASQLLLNRNAALPWFILVPDTLMSDILDLPAHHREAVLAECAAVSGYIKQVLGFTKVNFAGLGNVVPQMHLHVIGRNPSDPCWPLPVWGNLGGDAVYEARQLTAWQEDLVKLLGLVPANLQD